MGKIDDMRRMREQNFADTEKRRTDGPKAKPAATVDEPKPKPKAAEPAAKKADVTEGKCTECGKTKPVQNGVMAQHQKGFGKACPGSRKPPV